LNKQYDLCYTVSIYILLFTVGLYIENKTHVNDPGRQSSNDGGVKFDCPRKHCSVKAKQAYTADEWLSLTSYGQILHQNQICLSLDAFI